MKSADRSSPPDNSIRLVRIDSLAAADSPRINGMDTTHVRRLAAVSAPLPPVLVHRPTMRVVDGMHRIAAAVLKNQDSVEVRFFDGPEDQIFLRSVAANISHGLPLSVADRKAAAQRILASHPSLSDRAVAGHTGLDAKTVAGVRRCSAVGSPPLNSRTGADGRVHPLDRTAERMHAAELMTRDPALPLRAVVKETGLSLGTAHDVRRRLLRGEAPVPESRQGPGRGARGESPPARSGAGAGAPGPAAGGGAPSPVRAVPDPEARGRGAGSLAPRTRHPLETLRRLANDPSLRQSESGRDVIRWLHGHFLLDEAWRKRADAVPPHCTEAVADIARHCSESWLRFAEELAARRRSHHMAHVLDLRATQPTRN
ncbi:transcriptional regulator [Streptomyces sp. CAU 1734]|uniref:transcriptional regulator n=1 Tax=Streptomyces sp. CAU 1734 TaxID=3140360 RepID=UPI0032607AA5